MKPLRTVVVMFVFSLAAFADTWEEIVNRPVSYQVPGMDRVSVIPDQSYKEDQSGRLLLDVFIPPDTGEKERKPAVFLLHGGVSGDVKPKDWGSFHSRGRILAASGFVAVMFTHRLGYPEPHLKEAAADVEDAIQFVRRNAERYHVDPDRICLISYSAGGPLLSPALRDHPGYVRCLVAFYSFLDIRQTPDHKRYEAAETVQEFSPIYQMERHTAGMPPMLILRAGQDQIPTLNDSIDAFMTAALKKNAPVELINHPDGVHGFENKGENARTTEIIERTLSFLKTHLSRGASK